MFKPSSLIMLTITWTPATTDLRLLESSSSSLLSVSVWTFSEPCLLPRMNKFCIQRVNQMKHNFSKLPWIFKSTMVKCKSYLWVQVLVLSDLGYILFLKLVCRLNQCCSCGRHVSDWLKLKMLSTQQLFIKSGLFAPRSSWFFPHRLSLPNAKEETFLHNS